MNKLKLLSLFAAMLFASSMWAANPIGSIDAVSGKHGSITVNGWAIDPDNGNATVEVHVYLFSSETETDLAKAVKGINGTYANLDRPDLKGDWGTSVGELYGTLHGFDRTIDLYNLGVGSGTYYVRIYALNVAGSGNNVELTYSSDGVSVVKSVSVSNPYTVKYNANGGSGAPADQKKVQGINLTLSSTTPTRTGYTFNNWNTKQDGSGQSYAKGATYTTDFWSPTLYAQWTIVNYTIGYTLNGGSVSGNPTSYNVETATFTLNNPTRTGYTFKGWTGSNGNTPQTTVQITKGSTGNKTYTANWQINNYTIGYTLNGGSVSGNPTSYNVETNTFTLNNPTRTGYTFKGWTGSNGNTPQTTVQITKGSTGNKTYTANWTANTYTITYNLDGGSMSGNPSTYNIETNAFSLNAPVKNRYTFIGWTGSNGTTPQTSVQIAKGSTGNKNYTANWVYSRLAILEDLYNALGNDAWTGYGEQTGVISYSRGDDPDEFRATFMGGTYTIDIPFSDIPAASRVENTDGSFTYTLNVMLPALTGMSSETLHVTMKDGQITALDSENADIEMSKEAEICNWAALQEAMNAGGVIKLACNVSASSTDVALTVPAGKTVILELNGHTINRALTAPADNGSVIINNGTLAVMDSEGGKIIGGNTTGNGGAILNNGALTLYGGELTDNNAAGLGGGVYNNIDNTATTGFWMTGGYIMNNTANTHPAIGGDVVFNNLAVVQIYSDGTTVSAKTAKAGLANFSFIHPVMPDPVKFAMLAELYGALGNDTWTGYGENTGVISYSRGSEPNEFKATFMGGTYTIDIPFGDIPSVDVTPNTDDSYTYTLVVLLPAQTGLASETLHVTMKNGQITGLVSDNAGLVMGKETEICSWAALQEAMNAGGVIKLACNVSASSTDAALIVPAGKTVILELNGHIINRALTAPVDNGSVIINNGTLAVMDSEGGKIIGGNTTGNGGAILNNGALTLYGGELTGNRASAGGGVYNNIESTATTGFWMTGGLIDGNVANSNPAIGGDVIFNDYAAVQINADGKQVSIKTAVANMATYSYVKPVMPNFDDLPNTPVYYIGFQGTVLGGEMASFHSPEAPEISGYKFVRWEVQGGQVSDGFKVKAIYEALEPVNNAPAQVRVGNHTLEHRANNEYILK